MKKRTIAMFLSVALCLSVALTGCGADKSQQSNPSDDGKKSLTIAVLNDVVSLDPAVKDSGIEMQMASHLYDALVDYNADLSRKPGLAESWTVLDDGVTWEFKLRHGVKFSNGNDFNADDVVFSFERILNDPTLEMGVYLMRLQEVKKVDDYTVQLVTKIPYPVFDGSLVHIMMLDKETCEGLTSEEIAANPVGTGRYRLVEHVKESYIKLVRNDEYWGELPDAETVEFRVIANAATRTTALINGEVDFISNIPVMDVNRLENDPNVQVITNPSLSCNYMGFDQLEVNLLPRASFYEKTSAENLQSSFFMAGWGDSSGEGMVIFNDMLYTYDGKPGMGEGNRGHYSNAEVDALLDQASVEPDQAKRAALVEQVDQIARDEAAYIPLFFKHNIFGVRAGIQYTPSCDDHILAWDFTF